MGVARQKGHVLCCCPQAPDPKAHRTEQGDTRSPPTQERPHPGGHCLLLACRGQMGESSRTSPVTTGHPLLPGLCSGEERVRKEPGTFVEVWHP